MLVGSQGKSIRLMAYFPFQGGTMSYCPKVLYATQHCAGDQEEWEAETN